MEIPFAPPYIDDNIINEVVKVLKSGWITTGPKVRQLEDEISKLCMIEKAVAVNSATTGLFIALKWFGVGENDEVIIPAYTYSATALAVINAGARPVMVDCRKDFTMSTARLAEKITEKTKAIIPVDFAGLPCDYNRIKKIIDSKFNKQKFRPATENQHNLGRILILSDSAHSVGALYSKRPSAKQSDISVISLHAVKNITTAEGGIINLNLPKPFNNKNIYKHLKLLTLNGQTKDALSKSKTGSWEYDIILKGYKANLPDVLASMAIPVLKNYKNYHLPTRKHLFKIYNNTFSKWSVAQTPISIDQNRETSYHFYPLLLKGVNQNQRNKIIDLIAKQGIGVNVHYKPLPMLKYFSSLGYKIADFPVSSNLFSRMISLPIYTKLSLENANFICSAVIKAYEKVLNVKNS